MSGVAIFETAAVPFIIGVLLAGVGLLVVTPESAKRVLDAPFEPLR